MRTIYRIYRSAPNEPNTTYFTCRCGARAESIDVTEFGAMYPTQVPGPLIEECTCPRCITCGEPLDEHSRCDNVDCPLFNTLILIPD